MIKSANVSTITELPECRLPAAGSERGLRPLTAAELDHVAAAGSKPGASGGTCRDNPVYCPQQ